MSKMASARIPDELYEQGVQKLTSLGYGTTDLIRAAFDFFVQTSQLPKVASPQEIQGRELSAQQIEDLRLKLSKSRISLSLPSDWDYKDELVRGRREDYEALA